MFKGLLEPFEEIAPASKGYGSARDGVFAEGVCPGQGQPFSHVGKGERNFFCIGIIGFLVYHEVL